MSASVERVLERLGVEARKLGRRWWSERCPNPEHGEQNERHRYKNWFIRADGAPRAGQHHCFSCKFGGRLVDLVAAVRGCDEDEARAWLSDVEEAPAPAPVVSVRYAPLGARRRFELPGGVELGPLPSWNSVARDYALSRGLTAGQVERWGVGWALEGRLEGRVVFPIVDHAGRLCNYAARTFTGHETRYLAADEREGPDLAAMLGERFWPSAAERALATVVVFEGALSGMAIDRIVQRDLKPQNVYLAGLQGSDVSNPRRIARLASFGRVVSAADPDAAGDRASDDLASALRRVPFARFEYPRRGVDAADEDPAALARALRGILGA